MYWEHKPCGWNVNSMYTILYLYRFQTVSKGLGFSWVMLHSLEKSIFSDPIVFYCRTVFRSPWGDSLNSVYPQWRWVEGIWSKSRQVIHVSWDRISFVWTVSWSHRKSCILSARKILYILLSIKIYNARSSFIFIIWCDLHHIHLWNQNRTHQLQPMFKNAEPLGRRIPSPPPWAHRAASNNGAEAANKRSRSRAMAQRRPSGAQRGVERRVEECR